MKQGTYGEKDSDRKRKWGACNRTRNWNTQHTTAMSTAGTLDSMGSLYIDRGN